MLRNRFPEQCALKDQPSLHWTSLAEGNANFSIVIVFRYADDLMVGLGSGIARPSSQTVSIHSAITTSTAASAS
jgi:hypothetical protein